MRNVVALFALVVIAIGVTALFSRAPTPEPPQEPKSTPAAPPSPAVPETDRSAAYDKYKAGATHATLTVANRGTLGIELYPAAAPQTVRHIVELCKRHFYDGLLFHRFVPGFVIQGGDPGSKNVKPADIANISPEEAGQTYHLGEGGSGHTVPLEVKLPHLPDTLGLARSNDPQSGDSQFFINLGDNKQLDSGYCAFGRIVSGQEIVPTLRQGDRIQSFTVP